MMDATEEETDVGVGAEGVGVGVAEGTVVVMLLVSSEVEVSRDDESEPNSRPPNCTSKRATAIASPGGISTALDGICKNSKPII